MQSFEPKLTEAPRRADVKHLKENGQVFVGAVERGANRDRGAEHKSQEKRTWATFLCPRPSTNTSFWGAFVEDRIGWTCPPTIPTHPHVQPQQPHTCGVAFHETASQRRTDLGELYISIVPDGTRG